MNIISIFHEKGNTIQELTLAANDFVYNPPVNSAHAHNDTWLPFAEIKTHQLQFLEKSPNQIPKTFHLASNLVFHILYSWV